MAQENDQNTENATDAETNAALPTAAEWEEAKKKIEETKDLYLRTKADMENVRRRAQIDLDNAYKYSVEKFAKELVGVVDSLEHGISIANTEHDNAMREGMTLTLKLLLDIFEKFGIKCIEPVIGDEFNPKVHEALSMQHSTDVEPNKIMLVAQKGFTLQERLLRPARVIIAKAPVEAS
jgi:molecular chaperone GrpE